MTLDDLRVFIAVYETGNLSTVARDLDRTQSAVSQHVRRLERETGLPLLERRPRGVVPTEAGRVLYEAALGGIAALDAGLARLAELRDGGGAVRITTGGVTVRHFMADGIAEFRRRRPRTSLEFHAAHSTQRCVELLRGGRVDLAWITLGEPLPGIEHRPVVDLPWVLAVHASDPLASREAILPDDLAGIRYIAQPDDSTSRRRLEEEFVRLGCGRPEPVGVADWDTAALLAELGVGHAVLPALPRLAAGTPLVTVPIPSLAPISVGWAARQWTALSPPAAEFAALVTP
ncbi:HTH-type transcriptional activator CmpR [Actinomadura rubteroloni]|uniref:HTH-type transcriptional activator CmpR n=1 Tax=Actinomadura rubteroloni TaxID=1926885 RepID=A0A2P4UP71_9ACTN|nr:LysR family transcriptional regulator [Actinomadura rubteroloni]POM26832.1 HTH-type transcriptional activator CmpR [Actinomadura rubteroloni]